MGHRTAGHAAPPPLIHPELIKARIRMSHGSLQAFEAERDLPKNSVRDVLRGRSVRRTAIALADFMGLSVADLFPGRFVITGERKSYLRDSHRLNVKAA